RDGLATSLKDAGGLRTSRTRQRARNTLVVAQMAIALTLLIGSGLTLRNLAKLNRVDPGFDPNGVVTGGYFLPPARYSSPEQLRHFTVTTLERLAAIPSIDGAALTRSLPMTDGD